MVQNVIKHYNENPSLDRLFGLPGNILEGTGMSTLIPNTADWNISTVNQYASDIYMNKVSYSWTLDEKGNIVITKQKDTYEYLLTNVDLITQNFDSTWRFLDSDDYYDWFGGMKNAADIFKTKAGKEKADTQFVDIRNKNNYYSRTYTDSAAHFHFTGTARVFLTSPITKILWREPMQSRSPRVPMTKF